MFTKSQCTLIRQAIRDCPMNLEQIAVQARVSKATIAKMSSIHPRHGLSSTIMARVFPIIGLTMVIHRPNKFPP